MQPAQPETTPTGAPVAPDLTSGTASAEPTTVAPVATTTESPGVFGRAKGVLGGLFGGPAESTAQAPDQTPAITAEPAAAVPPVEAPMPTDPGQAPGLQPRRYAEPPQAPAASEELTPAWVAPTEPGSPVVADSSTATPDATPPASAAWPTEQATSSPTVDGNLAGAPAEGSSPEVTSDDSDPEDVMKTISDLRAAEGKSPLDVKLTGADSSVLLQGYMEYILNQGLTASLSALPETVRVNTLMAANRIARAQGERGITLSSADIDRFLENARQKRIVPPTSEQSLPAPSVEPSPAVSPTPAAEDPMAATASDALRGNTTGQPAPGIPGSGSSSFS